MSKSAAQLLYAPVLVDGLIEPGGEAQFCFFADVGATHDQTDPVGLVERDAHVRLDLWHRLTQ